MGGGGGGERRREKGEYIKRDKKKGEVSQMHLIPSPLLPLNGLTSSAIAPAVLLLSPVSRTTLSPILCKACTATGASGLMVSAITRAPNRIPGKRGDSYCHRGGLLQVNSTLLQFSTSLFYSLCLQLNTSLSYSLCL